MASGGMDFGAIERLAKSFQKALDERVIDRFIREFLNEMAMRSLAKTKRRTPVDQGELRRNWMVTRVEKQGNGYMIELYNNTEYGPYVEFGHRTGEGLTRWVEGRFMMTISMKEIEKQLPKYLEKKQAELINQIMNGR